MGSSILLNWKLWRPPWAFHNRKFACFYKRKRYQIFYRMRLGRLQGFKINVPLFIEYHSINLKIVLSRCLYQCLREVRLWEICPQSAEYDNFVSTRNSIEHLTTKVLEFQYTYSYWLGRFVIHVKVKLI